ncbi:stearoyl-CoA desaturase [Fistulifera solaris]|uniref:Delta-9 acyl-CoA desaturase n=2 Tax=Fistulifera solaris TaxID=1519565 RepID=W0TGU2_FISSO|nr:delta-9 acyl-CoA desaturase [Fistulifera solaris]BAO42832.1 delta-9 acyl-CoA desaturase [Fistulifera solaris]GAX19967.1 stearoyl-CoA desaturase [Fistulifera solaris]|eukprot:GAX19967.1 stearoyl-CoA desaturase [Fistulifera solaris]
MDFSPQMFRNIPKVAYDHYKEGNLNYPMIIYVSLVHIVAVAGLFALPKCSKETLLWAFILWPISGLGITSGVHRLWAHRSYEAHFVVRLVLMLANSIANQGSIYHWSRDHRVHHKYSETHADPHNATRGFFFAHMGWLLIKKHPDVVKAGRDMDFSDLLEDPLVVFQKKLDPWFALYMCYVMPAQVASHFWGEDFWTAFLVAGGLRYCYVLHCTWLVNSAAHLYGDHPYDVLSYPAENPLVSWFAIGEGWHNWHHKYPFDYSASEFGISSQFNPSRLFIDMLACVGLVWNRKRGLSAWAMGKARRERDAANGIPLPKAPPRPWEVEAKKVE